ncbi:hypothetical protein ACSTJS_24595, partial [Vibrio parahaemolyticus]
LDKMTGEFEQRSTGIVDGIAARSEEIISSVVERTEKIFDSMKNSSESLLSSGDKAGEALDVTISTLVAKVVSQTESAHETLSSQIGLFDGIVKEHGN